MDLIVMIMFNYENYMKVSKRHVFALQFLKNQLSGLLLGS